MHTAALPTTMIEALVAELAHVLTANAFVLATAESCTGGLIAASCTDLAGSSQWFDRGMVTYSNAAKVDMLGVPAPLIEEHGAVSEPVARAMAQGALKHSSAQLSLATTGIAGPSGATPGKPVGTVWFAWSSAQHTISEQRIFSGNRQAVRQAATIHALTQLLAHAKTLAKT